MTKTANKLKDALLVIAYPDSAYTFWETFFSEKWPPHTDEESMADQQNRINKLVTTRAIDYIADYILGLD